MAVSMDWSTYFNWKNILLLQAYINSDFFPFFSFFFLLFFFPCFMAFQTYAIPAGSCCRATKATCFAGGL